MTPDVAALVERLKALAESDDEPVALTGPERDTLTEAAAALESLTKALAEAESRAIHGWSEVDHKEAHLAEYREMLAKSESALAERTRELEAEKALHTYNTGALGEILHQSEQQLAEARDQLASAERERDWFREQLSMRLDQIGAALDATRPPQEDEKA